jgi:hypothetical protein
MTTLIYIYLSFALGTSLLIASVDKEFKWYHIFEVIILFPYLAFLLIQSIYEERTRK